MAQPFSLERLQEERRVWRRDHPVGFSARPKHLKNGDIDLYNWECIIPGKPGTSWEGGYLHLTLAFPELFPSQAPVAMFTPVIPHINVFASGRVCLSILTDGWKPSITLRQILIGIQNLLDSPNPKSPAHEANYNLYMADRSAYEKAIREFCRKNCKADFD